MRFIQQSSRFPTSYDRSIAANWKNNLRVVLVSTRNPLNIGAAARAMANFGFSRLCVVSPYDVAFREARSAVGAAPSSKRRRSSPPSPTPSPTAAGRRHDQRRASRVAASPAPAGVWRAADAARPPAAPVALVFGSEKFGLSNDDLSHCHWLMRIPTVGQDLSMNLGQAVALCLYEMARDPKAAAAKPAKIALRHAAETEQITLRLLEAWKSGYVNPSTAGSTDEKVRRLVRRLEIRQILWKLGEKLQKR